MIPIFAAGEVDGVPYIAMKYVPGDDARRLVRREGRLVPVRAARIVAQVAGALDAAHAGGLVHRDVKRRRARARPARGPRRPPR